MSDEEVGPPIDPERGVEDVHQGTGSGTFDVTVRVPVEFASADEMAEWLAQVVSSSMAQRRWIGSPMLIWRGEDDWYTLYDGVVAPLIADGRPPHD